ncbi:MAG: sporulation protein [Chloroflexota bacterium]|nr:sporulation protein [Chloroflexota bacterium]
MNVDELLNAAKDAMTARTVFAEPIERDGLLIIPPRRCEAAVVEAATAPRTAGAGFGLSAKPAGAYVVREGKVSWEPAIDVNRIVLGGQIVAIAALLVLRSMFRKRA